MHKAKIFTRRACRRVVICARAALLFLFKKSLSACPWALVCASGCVAKSLPRNPVAVFGFWVARCTRKQRLYLLPRALKVSLQATLFRQKLAARTSHCPVL